MSIKNRIFSIFKKWFFSWAAIDIGVLGAGIYLTLKYFQYWPSHHDTSSAWLEFWPNLTCEIIGAWLSVRIINLLINKRDNKHRARWRQADILIYWRRLAQDIKSHVGEYEFQRLEDEIQFYFEPHNLKSRKKYLDNSEKEDVETNINLMKELIKEYKHYVLIKDNFGNTEIENDIISIKNDLKIKAEMLISATEKARRNILEEEFELE